MENNFIQTYQFNYPIWIRKTIKKIKKHDRCYRIFESIRLVWLHQLHQCATVNELTVVQSKLDLIEKKMVDLIRRINIGYELLEELGIEYGRTKGF